MPSPFPGMDPWLEDPLHWRGVHARLITFIAGELQRALPPGFLADIDERMYVIYPERNIYPDVLLTQRPAGTPSRGGAAVLEAGADTEDAPGILSPAEITEGFIEIRAGERWEQVVTVVEVLSPANKRNGGGREEYLKKQREILQSETSLLEIDLLRRGQHTVAAPFEDLQQRGAWDYLISLRRGTEPHQFEYWMNSVRQRLPRVRVPLTQERPDVILDLQAAFTRAYDEGPYAARYDYREPPAVPLEGEDAAWMDALLREKGLRD